MLRRKACMHALGVKETCRLLDLCLHYRSHLRASKHLVQRCTCQCIWSSQVSTAFPKKGKRTEFQKQIDSPITATGNASNFSLVYTCNTFQATLSVLHSAGCIDSHSQYKCHWSTAHASWHSTPVIITHKPFLFWLILRAGCDPTRPE